MKEYYCSYEQSVKLKEFGFDEPCENVYSQKLPNHEPFSKRDDAVRYFQLTGNFLFTETLYPAPRLDQAAAWLREVKNVIVCPFPERYKEYVVQGIYSERLSGWDYEIWVDEEEYSEPKFGYIESYEKALELGIDKSLELLTYKLNRE